MYLYNSANIRCHARWGLYTWWTLFGIVLFGRTWKFLIAIIEIINYSLVVLVFIWVRQGIKVSISLCLRYEANITKNLQLYPLWYWYFKLFFCITKNPKLTHYDTNTPIFFYVTKNPNLYMCDTYTLYFSFNNGIFITLV